MYVHISSNIILSLSHIPMNIPLSLPFFMVSSTFVKACSDRLIDKLDGWWQSIYPHILYYFFCIFDMILSPYFSIFEISSYPPWYHHTSWPFLDQLPYFLVNHNISPYFYPLWYIYIQVKAPYFFDRWPSSVPHPLQLSSWAWRTQSWRRMEPEMNRGSIFYIFSAFWNIWVLNHHKPSIFGEVEP